MDPQTPPQDPPANTGRVAGSCPVCHSEISVENGAIHGGEPSGHYAELKAKAESADEWRDKLEQYRTEHPETPAAPPPADPPAAEETEYFL
ncbi:MAG TPA: hypothetical protein VKP61_15035 [Candidatus Acidoferrum sp.]|nr:hypothetical protein [Candidatus Acidoferrum sp.]